MFDKTSIRLADITSDSTEGSAYIQENSEYTENYREYTPNQNKIDQIKSWLHEHDERLDIRAFGAVWCGDCRINIPRLVKIAEFVAPEKMEVKILSNIKTKPPYNRKPGELIWKSPPSPKEVIDPRFDMVHIPAIFLFTRDGTCIGKVDENPEHTSTLEGDIYYYLTHRD